MLLGLLNFFLFSQKKANQATKKKKKRNAPKVDTWNLIEEREKSLSLRSSIYFYFPYNLHPYSNPGDRATPYSNPGDRATPNLVFSNNYLSVTKTAVYPHLIHF